MLAPDWKVDSTWNNGSWKSFSGTSAAAPFVSAMAALLYSHTPSLTPADVRTLITSHGPLVSDPLSPADSWPRIDPPQVMTAAVFGADTDADGISDDGDGSGVAGDNNCVDGEVLLCDDNCAFVADPSQSDPGGLGIGSAPDGIGTVCQCGDLNWSGFVDDVDVDDLRANLADPNGAPLMPGWGDRCQLISGSTTCGLVEITVLMRNLNVPPLPPTIGQVCASATGS